MRKDIAMAILKMDASPYKKISARTVLADYSMEEISSIEINEGYERPLVIIEILRGKPLSVHTVEEASFFYDMKIDTLEQFEFSSMVYDYETFDQLVYDWAKVYKMEEEPYPHDMVLVNGKYWTPAPNLPLIREMAIFE